jgi:hypothetical protein
MAANFTAIPEHGSQQKVRPKPRSDVQR